MSGRLAVLASVFRNHALRRVAGAFLAFSIGEWATWVAVIVYAYGRGGAPEAGFVAFIQLVPSVVMAPAAGTLGDRFSRKRVLLTAYVLQTMAMAAAAVALVTPDPKTASAPLSVYWDLGQAAQNMMLVAWDLGVGSVPATVYEPDVAKRILGYPDDRHCEFLLSFGYPARPEDLTRPPKAGGRRPLDEILHHERW